MCKTIFNYIFKRFCAYSFCFLFCFPIYAQEKKLLKGSVLDKNSTAVEGAEIRLKNHVQIGTITDSKGVFTLGIPKNITNDTVVISAIGYNDSELAITNFKPVIRLTKKGTSVDRVVLALKKNITSEFSTQQMSQLEIYTNPNSKGDVLNGVASLPASTNTDETATPVLRGSDSKRNRVYLNNVPLYNIVKGASLNNNIGSFSIFNTAILKSAELYASTPPIGFANVSGGAIVLNTQEDIRNMNSLLLSFTTIGGLYSRSLNKKNDTGIQLFSNYTDLALLKQLMPESLRAVKTYKSLDVGINSKFVINKKSRIKYFSQLTGERGNYDLSIFTYQDDFHNKNLRWYNVVNYDMKLKKSRLSANGGLSLTDKTFRFGNMDLSQKDRYGYLGLSWKRYFSDKLSIKVGTDYENIRISYNGYRPQFYYAYAPSSPKLPINDNNNLSYLSPYLYAKYKLNRYILISGGARNLLYQSLKDRLPIGFQASVRVMPGGNRHKFILSYGNYFSYNISDNYSDNLNLLQSRQLTFEYTFNSTFLDLQFSAYHKNERPVIESSYRFDKKIINGMDFLIRKSLGKRLKITATNTLLKPVLYMGNKRYKAQDDLDYFMKLTIDATMGKNINISASYNSRPGILYTPIAGSTYDKKYNLYRPNYSDINSARYDNYNLLSISLSKMITFKKIISVVFLGINNALGTKNQRDFTHSKDYSCETAVYFSRRTAFLGMVLTW